MGWWKIKDIETGMVDWDHECPTNHELTNAVPGYEVTDSMYNGDGPADLMGPMLKKISNLYKVSWGRPAKKDELIAVFNFCCNGMFRSNKDDQQSDIDVENTVGDKVEPFNKQFKRELADLLNSHCIENECDMPDFLLAEMIVEFIRGVGGPIKKTLDWHGVDSVCHPKKDIS